MRFIVINAYIKKYISNKWPNFTLKELKRTIIKEPKVSGWKKDKKVRAEINELKTKKTNKTKR